MTESNPSQQIRDLSQQMYGFRTEYKAATEKVSREFKELFAKQAKADKIIRLEFAIMLLILYVQIAIDLFD